MSLHLTRCTCFSAIHHHIKSCHKVNKTFMKHSATFFCDVEPEPDWFVSVPERRKQEGKRDSGKKKRSECRIFERKNGLKSVNKEKETG